MNPAYKCCPGDNIEKNILRQCIPSDMLPHDVLWRQKEQFSDGVGYSWIDSLREYCDSYTVKSNYTNNDHDLNSEESCYKDIFHSYFNTSNCNNITRRWKPSWSDTSDPSGRVQYSHREYSETFN